MSDDGGHAGLVPDWAHEVLSFWFNDVEPEDWFNSPLDLDVRIRDRFSVVHARVADLSDDDALIGPDAALAAIIVLDQFSRNIFRGKPDAFAYDAMARRLAEQAILRGWDAAMAKDQRAFVYLPFEHSEDVADQERSVALFQSLGDETYLDFAVRHRNVIAQFGRFPHRNDVLGRATTDEEAAFLAENPKGF